MQISSQQRQRALHNPALPWWRVGTMWFAFGGLAVVVIGSIGMAIVAVAGADAVLPEGSMRITSGTSINAQTPAMMARNHAATVSESMPADSGARR